jgi:hypothetical protein
MSRPRSCPTPPPLGVPTAFGRRAGGDSVVIVEDKVLGAGTPGCSAIPQDQRTKDCTQQSVVSDMYEEQE